MEEKLIEKTEKSIKKILDEGLNTNNLETLYKLSKIKHMAKEDEQMNYGNYGGRRAGYDAYGNYNNYGNYGEYGNYGRRGQDERYRGHEYIDRMYDNYGRYEGDRRRYGTNEETIKSLEYMLDSVVGFFEMLKSDANSQEEINMIRKYAQKIAQM